MLKATLVFTLGLTSVVQGDSSEAIAWGEAHGDELDYGQCAITSDDVYQTVFSDIIWTVGLRENGSCTIWPGGLEFEGPYIDISIGFNRIIGVQPDGSLECVYATSSSCYSGIPAGTFIQASAGKNGTYGHNLLLKENGSIDCWILPGTPGGNVCNEFDWPPNEYAYQKVSAGSTCGAALTTDGRAWAWGQFFNNLGSNFPEEVTFIDVAAGTNHCIALDENGNVFCRPPFFTDGCDNTPTSLFQQIDAGGSHNIGLTLDGEIEMWGANGFIDGLGLSWIPKGVFEQVSTGWYHNAALNQDGQIVTWGCGWDTTEVPTDMTFREVAAGDQMNIGIKQDGSVFCWGEDVLYYNPLTPEGFVTSTVCAGNGHLSIVNEQTGRVYCVGDDDACEGVPSAENFIQIDAGESHTVGLVEEGLIYCWGKNQFGQCESPKGLIAKSVASGSFHSMALSLDGHITCWGSNSFGQCDAPSDTVFAQVSGGMFHSVGLTQDGVITCWGLNNFGQCDAPAGDGFIMVDAGTWHSVAIASDGTAHCWGRNDQGQCDIPEGAKFSSISAGGTHNIALIDPSTNYCTTDLDNSGTTDLQDLIILLSDWGPCEELCVGDINSDGLTGYQDLLELISAWGPCSG